MQNPFTRNELINVLRGWHKAFKRIGRSHERNVQALAEAADLMEYEWISVEERYPEDQQHVLIAYKDNDYVSIGYFDEGFAEWDSLYDNEIVRPDYWMPLPEPPKEE